MNRKIETQDIRDVNNFETRLEELNWQMEGLVDLIKEVPSLETDDLIERFEVLSRALKNTPVLNTSDTQSFNSPQDFEDLRTLLTAYKDELNIRKVALPIIN